MERKKEFGQINRENRVMRIVIVIIEVRVKKDVWFEPSRSKRRTIPSYYSYFKSHRKEELRTEEEVKGKVE